VRALICVDVAFFQQRHAILRGGYITIPLGSDVRHAHLAQCRAALASASGVGDAHGDAAVQLEDREAISGEGHGGSTSNARAPARSLLKHAKTLHERVTFDRTDEARPISEADRIGEVSDYGEGLFGAKVHYGFMESPTSLRCCAG
jgi:hypothetical protein